MNKRQQKNMVKNIFAIILFAVSISLFGRAASYLFQNNLEDVAYIVLNLTLGCVTMSLAVLTKYMFSFIR